VAFRPEEERCTHCHGVLTVQKTHVRKVVTLHIGEIRARETVLICKTCRRTVGSQELRQRVAAGGNFGYDVLVYVGRALFLRHRTSREVVGELAARNVAISASEVDRLGKTFITSLAIAHQQSSEAIREAMRRNGGYVLHLDGTFDGHGPLLMSGIDSITQVVLANAKLPSERADKIVPFLQDIQRAFGDPLALVHDMGASILVAVAQVFPNTADFICHYHFLRDLGKDLFGGENDQIRKDLRAHRITAKLYEHTQKLKRIVEDNPRLVNSFCHAMDTGLQGDPPPVLVRAIAAYSLIQWVLDGKNQGGGYGFPFDRPHLAFAQRLLAADLQLHNVTRPHSSYGERSASGVDKIFLELARDLKRVSSEVSLRETIEAMERKTAVFDQLRHAMRIAPTSGSQGLNCDGMDTDIETIEKRVQDFCRWVQESGKLSEDKQYRKLLDQIDKYQDKLFCDPIAVHTPTGTITIQPQRTNNIMERFFRGIKRGYRRKTGNGSMGKTLKTMIADTPLAANLNNPQYIDILLAGKTTLEERFAEIDIQTVRRELKNSQKTPEKIPPEIKKLIALPQFPEKLARILHPLAQAA
jgi:hypothetical protein